MGADNVTNSSEASRGINVSCLDWFWRSFCWLALLAVSDVGGCGLSSIVQLLEDAMQVLMDCEDSVRLKFCWPTEARPDLCGCSLSATDTELRGTVVEVGLCSVSDVRDRLAEAGAEASGFSVSDSSIEMTETCAAVETWSLSDTNIDGLTETFVFEREHSFSDANTGGMTETAATLRERSFSDNSDELTETVVLERGRSLSDISTGAATVRERAFSDANTGGLTETSARARGRSFSDADARLFLCGLKAQSVPSRNFLPWPW